MLSFPRPRILVASMALLFAITADSAIAVAGELVGEQTALAVAPAIQTASASEAAPVDVPAVDSEPQQPGAGLLPGAENSASAQRLRDNNARAMLAALMALASSGGGRPYPLLPH
jgi:hypothetical protein